MISEFLFWGSCSRFARDLLKLPPLKSNSESGISNNSYYKMREVLINIQIIYNIYTINVFILYI